MTTTWQEGERALVFFDLETSGFSPDCDVLQIAMKCGNSIFNRYVQPTKPIDAGASEKNGLTNINGKLHLHGKPVPASSLEDVLQALLEYLRGLGKPCVLVAHNCFDFDAPRIVRAVKLCKLESAFRKEVAAFVDSLVLCRHRFTDRLLPGQLRLTNLASELLGLDVSAAHDALGDVKLLEALVDKYFKQSVMAMTARSFNSFLP